MLSSINVPTTADRETSLEWRTVDLLIDSLTNIRQEIHMFEETAKSENFFDEICSPTPSIQTRAYQDLFAGATASGRPLIVSLTALWATEECYLRAWRYAWSRMDQGLKPKDKDVMQRTFIPNWSSAEFEAFVRRIGGLVNKFGGYYEEGGWEWRECEAIWRQVLWFAIPRTFASSRGDAEFLFVLTVVVQGRERVLAEDGPLLSIQTAETVFTSFERVALSRTQEPWTSRVATDRRRMTLRVRRVEMSGLRIQQTHE